MLGSRPGRLPSQGEIVAGLLADDGWSVLRTSSAVNPWQRAASVAADLMRWRGSVDVVVVNVYSGRAFAQAELATTVARRLGKSVVLHLHGGGLPAFTARHPARVDTVLSRADAIVAPSPYLADLARSRGVDAAVIPNVVAVAAIPFRARSELRPNVLWMRAFEPLYRPFLALDAFALVHDEVPAATMTMAGPDNGQFARVRTAVVDRDLGHCVRFPGVLGRAAVLAALGNHDMVLTTASVDNAPVSVLEAAAAGLPVVAASVGGLPDLLTDGEDALLVDGDEPAALAAAVLRLVREPELATRLSTNGRRLAEGSDWARVRGRWETLLTGVAGR